MCPWKITGDAFLEVPVDTNKKAHPIKSDEL